jgi:hypothetical protein
MAGWHSVIGGARRPGIGLLLAGVAVVLWATIVVLNPAPRAGSRVETTPPPTAELVPGDLPTGPYLLLDAPGVGRDVTVTLASAGWRDGGDGILIKNDSPANPDAAGLIVFTGTGGSAGERSDLVVYRDACHWAGPMPQAPVATVEEAVAALASQESSQPTLPVDVAVGSRSGKAVTLRVPADIRLERCDQGQLRYFTVGSDNGRGGYVAGQIDELRVVSPPGAAGIVIFDMVYDDAISLRLVEELRRMVESATFG